MEPWRQQAFERFPELAAQCEAADTPYELWIDLRDAFEAAYDKTPFDESLITRIYRYAEWCADQPRRETAADDLLTCVAVSFWEHIPLHPLARADMPRWWKIEDMEDGPHGEPNVFAYYLSAEDFEELKRFMERERDRFDPTLSSES